MTYKRIKTGKLGETLALRYLKRSGYRIIEKNFKTKQGEIDIIGEDNGCISFIEVRSSDSDAFGKPEYSIDIRKQKRIAKAALMYIKQKHLEGSDCRFDVVCIEDTNSPFPKINLIKNAFELDNWYRY